MNRKKEAHAEIAEDAKGRREWGVGNMRNNLFVKQLFLGVALVVLFAACDAAGSLAGNRDEIHQKVKENASYKVRFDTLGGDPVPDSQTVKYNTLLNQPTDPKKEDDTYFTGWFRENGNPWNFKTDRVTSNVTLHAGWAELPDGYASVTFYSGVVTQVDTQLVKIDDPVKQPSGLTMPGSYLEGWYTNENFTSGTKWEFETGVSEKYLTLYAKWMQVESNHVVVTFISGSGPGAVDGGSPVPDDQRIINDGSGKVIEPTPLPSRTDNSFGGWYKDADRKIQWIFGTDTVSGPISLYALWITPGCRAVNFDSNGGNPARDQIEVEYGAKVSGELPTRTGYTAKWYALPRTGGDSEWNFASDSVIDNITLRAEWTPITYTVRYDQNADDATGATVDSTHIYDQPKNLNANGFSRTGYTFAGWGTSSAGPIVYMDEQSVINLRNTTGIFDLYAQWNFIGFHFLYPEFDFDAVKKDYAYGEQLSLYGFTITEIWEDGPRYFVYDEDFSYVDIYVSGYDAFASGDQTVTVGYKGWSANFEVTVNPPINMPEPTESKTLMILQANTYGNNNGLPDSATGGGFPVSLVELYNNTDEIIDLSADNYYLFIGDATSWTYKIKLAGFIPVHCSFLVVTNNTSEINQTPRAALPPADQTADFKISNNSFKVALIKNAASLTLPNARNPFDTDGKGGKVSGYVDMLGAINGSTYSVNAYETAPAAQSRPQSPRRASLVDTDNNLVDFLMADYRGYSGPSGMPDSELYKYWPRNSDGPWDPITGIPKIDPALPEEP